jgi:hypothetical protein
VKGVFVELPAFERHRKNYLDDEALRSLQSLLMKDPSAGDAIPAAQRQVLKRMIKAELEARRTS